MYYLFLLAIIVLFFYSLIFKFKIDIFIIAGWCSLIYFYPAFFGYGILKSNYHKLDGNVYLIFSFYIIAMLLMHHIHITRRISVKENKKNSNTKIIFVYNLIFYITTVLYLFSIRHTIFAYHTDTIVPRIIIPFYLYSTYHSIPFTLMAVHKKAKFNIIIGFIYHILLFYQGHRSYVVILCLSFLFSHLIGKQFDFKKKLTILTAGVPIGILGFLGKDIYVALRSYFVYGRPIDVITNVFSKYNILDSLIKNEAFSQIAILSITIKNNIRLPIEYIFTYISKLFLFTDITGIQNFYDLFVNSTRTHVNYGIAFNIFSEPYAIGGLIGVLIFIILLSIYYSVLQYLLEKTPSVLFYFILITLIIYSTFYIHRNNLNNLILFVQIYIGSYFVIENICKINLTRRSRRTTENGNKRN